MTSSSSTLPTISVLTTGSEILDGRVLDANSNFIAKQLTEIGLKLNRVLSVDDDFDDLVQGLQYLHLHTDIVITSGGLGPTADDLTRDIFAAYYNTSLEEFPAARQHLEQFYAARKRTLDPSNLKQALLPIGSTMIPNPNGTAPGFMFTNPAEKTVCSLSGVPREFQAMFVETVLPFIRSKITAVPQYYRQGFKLFGLPESVVGKRVVDLQLPREVTVSYRAAFPEVHLVLKYEGSSTGILDNASQKIRESDLHPHIFTDQTEESFAEGIQKLLVKGSETVAVAESCSGGLLSDLFIAPRGASKVFLGGVIAYSNAIKVAELGVSQETINKFGAVSEEVALEMAVGIRKRCGATYGLSITGVAGPDGGTEQKPVGTFCVGFSSLDKSIVRTCFFLSDRTSIRRYSAYVAAELLRRHVSGAAIDESFPVLKKI